jgi:hypothetical protein
LLAPVEAEGVLLPLLSSVLLSPTRKGELERERREEQDRKREEQLFQIDVWYHGRREAKEKASPE